MQTDDSSQIMTHHAKRIWFKWFIKKCYKCGHFLALTILPEESANAWHFKPKTGKKKKRFLVNCMSTYINFLSHKNKNVVSRSMVCACVCTWMQLNLALVRVNDWSSLLLLFFFIFKLVNQQCIKKYKKRPSFKIQKAIQLV